jgi:HEAT repeat protein
MTAWALIACVSFLILGCEQESAIPAVPLFENEPTSFWVQRLPSREAFTALRELAVDDPEAADALVGSVLKSDPTWREAFWRYLGPVGDGRLVPAILRLLDQLDYGDGEACRLIAECLQRSGRLSPDQLEVLARDLSANDAKRRRWVAVALGEVGIDSIEVSNRLERHLDDPDLLVRSSVAFSLWRVTRRADPSFDVLVQLSRDGNGAVRENALWAISVLGTQASSERLRSRVAALMISDPDPYVRQRLCFHVGPAGAYGVILEPTLVQIAESDSNPDVRKEAADSLQHLRRGPRHPPAARWGDRP